MPLYNPSTAFDIDITMGLIGRQGRNPTPPVPSGDTITMEDADPITMEDGDTITTE